MKLLSFTHCSRDSFGLLRGDSVYDLASLYPACGCLDDLLSSGQRPRDSELRACPRFGLADIQYRPPLDAPPKIICVGINYPARNEEYQDSQPAGYPSIFVRFPGSFVGHRQPLIIPRESAQLDYEGEIAIILGKGGRRIAKEDALAHISAVTLCNEGTVRDWVRHAKFNVTQGKNFDCSGAIGPYLVTADDITDFADLELKTIVNGELRQHDNTKRMLYPMACLIAYVSTFTTLQVNDIIITGTPTGSGARLNPPRWLTAGDQVTIQCPQIGELSNSVQSE